MSFWIVSGKSTSGDFLRVLSGVKLPRLFLQIKKGACLDLTLQGFHCVPPFQATAGVLSLDIKS